MSRCSADQKDKNVVSKLFRKHRVKHAGLVPAATCAAEAHALRCTLTRCGVDGVDGVDAASSVSLSLGAWGELLTRASCDRCSHGRVQEQGLDLKSAPDPGNGPPSPPASRQAPSGTTPAHHGPPPGDADDGECHLGTTVGT